LKEGRCGSAGADHRVDIIYQISGTFHKSKIIKKVMIYLMIIHRIKEIRERRKKKPVGYV